MNTDHTAHAEGPSSHPQAATLEFVDVAKTYPGADEPAIQDLSFEVPAGEICVLVGPSGCGKTTAMRLVNRMIELTSGDILLDGRSVRDRAPAELRRDIGYAIQQIGLFPHQSIGENIATVPRLKGWDRARIRRRVDEHARTHMRRSGRSPRMPSLPVGSGVPAGRTKSGYAPLALVIGGVEASANAAQ